MAKLSSFIKIEGTLGDLTFYKTADGHLVKTKSSISKDKMQNDPAFARTRENQKEFGSNAKSGKILRDAVGLILNSSKDPKLSGRMVRIMNGIKNLDLISGRGQRRVCVGIESPEGKQFLKNFDFAKSPLSGVLRAPFAVNTDTGEINIEVFSTQEQLRFPEGATHVNFRSAFINLDFETGVYERSYSPVVNLPITPQQNSVKLLPETVPAGFGTQIYLLMIEFLQDVNGIQYPLKGSNNVLNIVEVV